MKERIEGGPDGPDLAADRVAEINRLSREIRERLAEMVEDLRTAKPADLKAICSKLDHVHAAHLKVVAAEDAFHAKLGTDPDADAIDYDEIRDEIGCRLDRLRQSIVAEAVSGTADAGAAGDTALSLRFLGDAASDRTKR